MTPRGHEIVWHCSPLASSEHASLRETESGHRFDGLVVVPLGDIPCHIEYQVIVDREWRPRETTALVTTTSGSRRIELRSDPGHHWELDGAPARHLEACTDVDLGWTPATNTVPIRRLALDVGKSAMITAAWVRFPELDVVVDEQQYTRLAVDRWRYRSGDYDFELVTDTTTGLVLHYGDDLWQAAATRSMDFLG